MTNEDILLTLYNYMKLVIPNVDANISFERERFIVIYLYL